MSEMSKTNLNIGRFSGFYATDLISNNLHALVSLPTYTFIPHCPIIFASAIVTMPLICLKELKKLDMKVMNAGPTSTHLLPDYSHHVQKYVLLTNLETCVTSNLFILLICAK